MEIKAANCCTAYDCIHPRAQINNFFLLRYEVIASYLSVSCTISDRYGQAPANRLATLEIEIFVPFLREENT